jgi:hypothetical protein
VIASSRSSSAWKVLTLADALGVPSLGMRTSLWPWLVFPAIAGGVVGWLVDDTLWFAIALFFAMFLTTLTIGLIQGKTRWQQRRGPRD